MLGEIVAGKNYATGWIRSDPVLPQTMGLTLHLGTINLLVPDPRGEHRIFYQDLLPPMMRRAGVVRFCACTLAGHPAYVVATWRGAQHNPQDRSQRQEYADRTLIEIMTETKIPGIVYGLVDVALEYDPADVQKRRIA